MPSGDIAWLWAGLRQCAIFGGMSFAQIAEHDVCASRPARWYKCSGSQRRVASQLVRALSESAIMIACADCAATGLAAQQ